MTSETMPPVLHPPALTLSERQRTVHLLRNLAAPLALIVHQLEGQADPDVVWDLGCITDRLVELAAELEKETDHAA